MENVVNVEPQNLGQFDAEEQNNVISDWSQYDRLEQSFSHYRAFLTSRTMLRLFERYQPSLLQVSQQSLSCIYLIYLYLFKQADLTSAELGTIQDPETLNPDLYEALDDMEFTIQKHRLTLASLDDFYDLKLKERLSFAKELMVLQELEKVREEPSYREPVINELERFYHKMRTEQENRLSGQIRNIKAVERNCTLLLRDQAQNSMLRHSREESRQIARRELKKLLEYWKRFSENSSAYIKGIALF
jgi:hypothetical protein